MPSTRTVPRILHPKPWFSGLLLVAGMAGFAAAWTLLALAIMRQCSWMAAVGAVDAVFLLRMAQMRPGWARAAIAVLATGLAVVLANWWIAGSQMGYSVGMPTLEALQRLGSQHARTLIALANTPTDLAWLGIGLVVAAWLGRVWSLPPVQPPDR